MERSIINKSRSGLPLSWLKKDFLSTTIFRFYDEGEFTTMKKLAYKFGDKIYSGFIS
jgi:hypothetical protein